MLCRIAPARPAYVSAIVRFFGMFPKTSGNIVMPIIQIRIKKELNSLAK